MEQQLLRLIYYSVFYSVPFYNYLNSFDICYVFTGGVIICSTFLEFSSGIAFGFTTLSAVLFPKSSPVILTALCATF